MNRLVNALLARPHVIDLAVQRGAAPFELLRQGLGDALLSVQEWESIAHDSRLLDPLSTGYLPIITAPDWDGALSLTEGRTVGGSGWWTVMIPATTGQVGLTIPQDSSNAGLIAMFSGPADTARVLVYDPASGSLTRAPGEAHCAAPSRGLCAPGICGGCAARKVYDEATRSIGIKCQCPDLAD